MRSPSATSSIRPFTKASWLATAVVGLGLTACGGGGGSGGSAPVTASDPLKVDTTYGEGGVATLPQGSSLGIQADGKLLIAGSRVTAPTPLPNVGGLPTKQAYVMRVDADGAVDRSFGVNGESRFSVKGSDEPVDIQVQSSGRGLVAVMAHEPCSIPSFQERCLTASGSTGSWHNTVVGFTPAGTQDNTFGTQGIGEGFFSTNINTLSLAIQSDQKPLLLTSNNFEPLQIYGRALRRLTANGQPDVAFNQVGSSQPINTPQPSVPCAASGEAVLALQNGNIISAGTLQGRVYDDPASHPGLCVAVHSSNSQAQTSGGWTSFGALLKEYKLASHPDGGFVVAARTCATSANSDCQLSIAKFSANGVLDASFGNKGITRTMLPANYQLKSFFVQDDRSMRAFGAIEESAAAGTSARRFRAVWTSLSSSDSTQPDDLTVVATSIQDPPTSAEPRQVLRDGSGRWLVVSADNDSQGNRVLKVVRTRGTSAGNP